jgi:IS30 family transposase
MLTWHLFTSEPRPGAPRQIGDDAIAETVRKTLETLPAGRTHWSSRAMAREIGHAPSTVLQSARHRRAAYQGRQKRNYLDPSVLQEVL